jgi:hypothetical protein
VQEETIRHHGDLYIDSDGVAILDIRDGRVALGSVVAAPFGVGWPCDLEEELEGVDALTAALS